MQEDARDEWRPVASREELMARPDPEGAWWRAHFARWDAATEAFEAEHGPGSAEHALLSVFPQPTGAWREEGGEEEGDEEEEGGGGEAP